MTQSWKSHIIASDILCGHKLADWVKEGITQSVTLGAKGH